MSTLRKLPVSETGAIVPDSLLKKYGGVVIRKQTGESIFREGEKALAYHVVKRGKVKMVNTSEEGKEFIQGYFGDGESFGDPPFFTEGTYPASAVAVSSSEIWKVQRSDFLRLLKENFEIHFRITQALGSRLIYKSIMLSEIAIEEAEHRIRTLLDYVKESVLRQGKESVVPFSRQQIADMVGLRVETVIRTIKDLEQRELVKLTKEGKIILR